MTQRVDVSLNFKSSSSVFMPLTSKKLRGHIASGLYFRPCIRACVDVCLRAPVCHECRIEGTVHDSFKVSYMDSSLKLADPGFFLLFFPCPSCFPFYELCPFRENHNERLSARYLKKSFS